MATILERLRAAREEWVKVGTFELLFRRPTRFQMAQWAKSADADGEGDPSVRRAVLDPRVPIRESLIGWRGVTEIMVVPGGEPRAIEFDLDTCLEWLEDNPVLLSEACAGLNGLIESHLARERDAEKN